MACRNMGPQPVDSPQTLVQGVPQAEEEDRVM